MIYQKYNKEFELEVVDLLNTCFEGKNITPKSFRWKHFDAFFNKKVRAMIAIDNHKVCAFVCFTPVSVIKGGDNFDFYSCSVQATHPDYRRRGIVTDLTQIIENELPKSINYLGFSNKNGIQIDLHSKKINYEILGRLNTIYLVSSPYFSNFKIKPVESIEQIDLSQNFLGFQKNVNYINWRYTENPKNKYKIFEIQDPSKTIGFVIAKKNFFVYDVFDVLTLNIEDLKECIRVFNSYAFKDFTPICSYTYLPNKFWNIVFPKISIIKKNDLFFTVKSLNKYLLDFNNWIIQGGDIQ